MQNYIISFIRDLAIRTILKNIFKESVPGFDNLLNFRFVFILLIYVFIVISFLLFFWRLFSCYFPNFL